jgi:hypothetical protein
VADLLRVGKPAAKQKTITASGGGRVPRWHIGATREFGDPGRSIDAVHDLLSTRGREENECSSMKQSFTN